MGFRGLTCFFEQNVRYTPTVRMCACALLVLGGKVIVLVGICCFSGGLNSHFLPQNVPGSFAHFVLARCRVDCMNFHLCKW
jgi:hypothetical protein